MFQDDNMNTGDCPVLVHYGRKAMAPADRCETLRSLPMKQVHVWSIRYASHVDIYMRSYNYMELFGPSTTATVTMLDNHVAKNDQRNLLSQVI